MEEKFAFPELETERLYIRVLQESDSTAVFRHFADEEVTRYMDIPLAKNSLRRQRLSGFTQRIPAAAGGFLTKLPDSWREPWGITAG